MVVNSILLFRLPEI